MIRKDEGPWQSGWGSGVQTHSAREELSWEGSGPLPYLQLLDRLSTFADNQAGLPRGDHDLLHCAVLAPVGVVVELSWGAPTTPRDDVIQHHLRFPGKGKNGCHHLREDWPGSSTQVPGKEIPTHTV